MPDHTDTIITIPNDTTEVVVGSAHTSGQVIHHLVNAAAGTFPIDGTIVVIPHKNLMANYVAAQRAMIHAMKGRVDQQFSATYSRAQIQAWLNEELERAK